jgi:hypothetical protein
MQLRGRSAVRVLSLSQPWLWSIDTYVSPPGGVEPKRIENRSWPCPAAVIGERIALHAARSWDDDAISFFVKLGIEHPARRELYDKGKITSVATVTDVIDCTETGHRSPPPGQEYWLFGPFGWVLVDVRRLPAPIPWRGAQGLRHLPSETVLEIERQIGRAA